MLQRAGGRCKPVRTVWVIWFLSWLREIAVRKHGRPVIGFGLVGVREWLRIFRSKQGGTANYLFVPEAGLLQGFFILLEVRL